MCGIAGIVSLDGFDPQLLMQMTHLVSYRGPNGFGFAYAVLGRDSQTEVIQNENRAPAAIAPVVGLGSRRLAILDISSNGNMPMQSEDGDLCIVFNGEIYNYQEVRAQLENQGHRFRTGTDTEVILEAYRQWGEDCLQRFNGMWSFALWDRSSQRLFCARDRFGVKPFYYALSDSRFYFGSEIKQILKAAGPSRAANSRIVFDFLEWGLLDHSSETFFEGINQLPGGHCLTLELSAPLRPRIGRYWELEVRPETEIGVNAATEEFQARFENAVRIRLRSDVPVGVCLSGGLDSSSILCEAKRIAPDAQFQTFSACFKEKEFDERDYISAAVSAVQGVGHETFPQGHSFWENVRSIVYHHDEPLGGVSAFAQWCVMADAKNHGVPVILGGQGGDEALCGYQKYRYFYIWHLLRHANPRFARELFFWNQNGTTSYWNASSVSRYLPPSAGRLFSLTKRICTTDFQNATRGQTSRLGSANTIAERQKTDLVYSSIPALLRHEDRNSMAHSVESRLPFLDYELVEFAVNCPASLKLRDGWSKWLLRNAMVHTLPDKIRLRKTKLGFNTPETDWMRHGLQNGQRRLWDTPTLKMGRFVNASKLAQECQKFLGGASGSMPASSLFRAISLELWAQVQQVS